MNTQVIFKIDKNLKNKAMKKAQSEGISFTTILKLATKAFVENQLNVGLVTKEEFNPRTRKAIISELKMLRMVKIFLRDLKMRKMLSLISRINIWRFIFIKISKEIEEIISQNKESILCSLGFIYERQDSCDA